MQTVWMVVVMLFVACVLASLVYALYALSPFARHEDVYHDPGVRQDSPRLD